MLMGRPTICTNYGGPTDFVNNENGWPISYQESPVFGMPWENYKGDQVWADINIIEARKAMREAYTNKELAIQKGIKGQELISTNFSWPVIAEKMKNRLEQV
jgi:glycosyltransferase involved in cell wall biosynthesis